MTVKEKKAAANYLIAKDNPHKGYKRCGNCCRRTWSYTYCELHNIPVGYFGICPDHDYGSEQLTNM